MKPIFAKFLLTICALSACSNVLAAGHLDDRKKQMIQDLEVIKHHFEAGYAPIAWKKESVDCDLEIAFEKAKSQILAAPSIDTKHFHHIVRQFMNTTRDYHVDVVFYSTEAAALPFSVRGAEGRYFIDWIDPVRLSSSYFPIRVGDELLQFGERPIAEVMQMLIFDSGKKSNAKTDQRLAEIKLTQRNGMAGDIVPKGAIMISTRSAATGKVDTVQLHWSYTPEYVSSPLDFLESFKLLSNFFWEPEGDHKLEIPQVSMANPLHEAYASKSADRTGGLGAKKSSLPFLGETIWINENEPKKEEEALSTWNAYIYRHPNGQSIGYIRIPHYHESQSMAIEFGEIINFLEEKTDALVIDQLHNFGGYVDYTYTLASILAVEPLKAPYHRIKITQKEVMGAYMTLEMIKLIDLMLLSEESKKEKDDKKNQEEDGDKKEGKEEKANQKEENSINYQQLMFLKSYYELILNEWNRGESLTRPTPILGVDRINPHPKYRYTKPILMLIDEMDFSGADFMPAILQDNHRAVLFGCRTAGAGGFVTSFQFPNTNGIAVCAYTGSIAERPNRKKIENVGITPDIEYQLTAEDVQGGYKGYVNAVNQAVQQLLK